MDNNGLFGQIYNPDVLTCLANLSNDEVFTPPDMANAILDMLPEELFRNPDIKFLDPCCKSGVFLREIAKRLLVGLEPQMPDLQDRIDHIFHNQLYGIAMVCIAVTDLDKNENFINTPDATYDLTKGMAGAMPHNPMDLITKITNVSPGDKGAQIWQEALETFFCSDHELMAYVQEIVGMAAVGKVNAEQMIIAYGGGANGKSTFWNCIARVLGTYSGKLSAEALTLNCKRNVKPEICSGGIGRGSPAI